MKRWLCLQIGARDHYLLARALHRRNRLAALVTDYWSRVQVKSPRWESLVRSVQRFHPDLADAPVVDFPWRTAVFEVAAGFRRLKGWHRICDRNEWFQKRAAQSVRALCDTQPLPGGVVSYSYAAGIPFRVARDLGLNTVLGQIDGGPVEEEIVAAAHEKHAEYAGPWERAPESYWQNWRDEVELSNRVIVNSEWSRQCLINAGVGRDMIRVIPLAYEPEGVETTPQRDVPSRFSRSRPLRILFLGQVTLRKGIAELLEAVHILRDAPVEWTIAGPIGIRVPPRFRSHPRVRWTGPVPRGSTRQVYREADVFILPTLSDGFALTQLEARACGLPLIVSKNCGDVVIHGESGLLLDAVTGQAIAQAVLSLLEEPAVLRKFAQPNHRERSTLADFAERLESLLREG